jgi:ATP-dependent Lhr-like helicase
MLHDVVVTKIREVLSGDKQPVYLDQVAAAHLQEARKTFREAGLERLAVVTDDADLVLFPWKGTKTLDALRLALRQAGVQVTPASISLSVSARSRDQLREALQAVSQASHIDGAELAQFDENLERAKYDSYIPRDLLRHAAALDRLDTSRVPEVSRNLLRSFES